MSIEEALSKLTDAVTKQTAVLEKNNALLEQVNAGREAAISAAEKLGGASTTKATKANKAAEKPAEAAPAAAPAPTPAPAPAKEDLSGDAGVTIMREIWGGYCAVDDPVELEARKATLARALKLCGAATLSGVPEAKRADFVLWGRTLSKGENVEELAEESSSNGLLD